MPAMPVIPKIRGVCDCNDADLDAACLQDLCVQNFRMAGGCECTCKVMAFQACAVFEPFDDCSCTDGTTSPGQIISSVWIGWIDASAGKTLADIATLTCGDPTVTYRLFGFAAGEWPGCATSGGTPIAWSGVDFALNDIVANPLAVCTGGVFEFAATDFNLTIVPVPGGTGTDCTQVGGWPVLAVQAEDQCGHVLVYCPFVGVAGEEFACAVVCCTFVIDSPSTVPCNNPDTPGIGHVVIVYHAPPACDCVGVTTIYMGCDSGGIGGTPFVLDAGGGIIDFEVPCSEATVVFYKVANVYDDPGQPCSEQCPNNFAIFEVTVPLDPP